MELSSLYLRPINALLHNPVHSFICCVTVLQPIKSPERSDISCLRIVPSLKLHFFCLLVHLAQKGIPISHDKRAWSGIVLEGSYDPTSPASSNNARDFVIVKSLNAYHEEQYNINQPPIDPLH